MEEKIQGLKKALRISMVVSLIAGLFFICASVVCDLASVTFACSAANLYLGYAMGQSMSDYKYVCEIERDL